MTGRQSVIEKIRMDKGIPISTLIRGVMSRANYTRLRDQTIQPAFDVMLALLTQLKVTLMEYTFLTEADVELEWLVRRALDERDVNQLCQLQQQLEGRELAPRLMDYQLVLPLWLAQAENKPLPIDVLEQLRQMLYTTDLWYHHELTVFRYTVFCFNTQELLHYTEKVAQALARYQGLTPHEHEAARLLIEVILLMVERHDFKAAKAVLVILNRVALGQDAIYERIVRDALILRLGDLEKATGIPLIQAKIEALVLLEQDCLARRLELLLPQHD